MIVMDCTLRDGGYQNNWDFDIVLANEYLKVMENVKINAIEVGFRSPPQKKIGLFGKVTDFFIEENLYIPDVEYFGVMINSSDVDYTLVKKLFTYCDESPINLVRSATHFYGVDEAETVLKYIKDLGYKITLNLMQAANKSYEEVKNTAKKIKKWGCVDVLYLADSFGDMDHDSVNYAFQAIRESWDGEIGFHGHNNKGQSLSNTLESIDIDVDWIDSTMMGMGRGAGNTETEYLLNELNKRNFEFDLEPIYELAMNYFYPLQCEYKWGPSLPYYLSAEYNIHPTYIQKMLSEYPIQSIFKAILFLKDRKSSSFDKDLLREALSE